LRLVLLLLSQVLLVYLLLVLLLLLLLVLFPRHRSRGHATLHSQWTLAGISSGARRSRSKVHLEASVVDGLHSRRVAAGHRVILAVLAEGRVRIVMLRHVGTVLVAIPQPLRGVLSLLWVFFGFVALFTIRSPRQLRLD